MTDQPDEWAMQKSVDLINGKIGHTTEEWCALRDNIARALVAEREAADKSATERAARIAMQRPSDLYYCDCGNTDRAELQNEIAAAIRKGDE